MILIPAVDNEEPILIEVDKSGDLSVYQSPAIPASRVSADFVYVHEKARMEFAQAVLPKGYAIVPSEPTTAAGQVHVSDRGFQNMEPVPSAYGGVVRIYESSAAMHPHIWVAVRQPEDMNQWAAEGKDDEKFTGQWRESHAHLRIEDAVTLRNQLDYLIANHYQGGE